MTTTTTTRTTTKTKTTKARAFSLVEVLVSAALFLASATGVISAVSSASAAYMHQRRLTQAASIGEFKMEELLLRYSSHADMAMTTTAPKFLCLTPALTTLATCTASTTATKATADATLGQNYLVYWTVRQAPVLGLRQIDLTVAWREGATQRELPLMTYRR